MDTQSYMQPKKSVLDLVARIILEVIVVAAPIFFIPALSVPFTSGRVVFLTIAVIASFVVWAVARLKDGIFELPRTWGYVFLGVSLLTYALSAFLSVNPSVSLSGQIYELGTAGSVLIMTLVSFMASILVKRESDVSRFFLLVFAAATFVGVHQMLRLFFGANILSFGILASKAENLVGRWNDLAVFFGAVVSSVIVLLDRGIVDKTLRILAYVTLGLGAVILVMVNFLSAWIVLAAIMLALLVYTFVRSQQNGNKKISILVVSTLVVSVLFMVLGGSISAKLSEIFGISHVEVRPSWQSTLEIGGKTLTQDPVFGVGPNRFTSEWLRNKPAGINGTLFWSVDFSQGIGFVPSMLSTTGILGTLAMLSLIGYVLFIGFKGVFFEGSHNPRMQAFTTASFVSVLYFWVFLVIYSPSYSIVFLTFLTTGVLFAILKIGGVIPELRISTLNSSVKGFVSVLILIVLVLSLSVFGYSTVRKTLAATSFQSGVIAINRDGDLVKGEALISKALSMDSFDLYNRFLSDLYLIKVNNTLNDKSLTQNEAAAQFQNELGVAIQSARAAIEMDPTDYQNYVALGRVYESVVPLGIQGSYESAKDAYNKAIELNPSGPQLHMYLARLELSKGDRVAARKAIEAALGLKGDYSDAIFLLSQIEIAEGRLSEAARAVEAVAILSPNDPGVFFQLGLLRYNERNWQNAAAAFTRAIQISPVYANAKYFLGLALYQLNDVENAIRQFEDLNKSNPDNTEVVSILSNLKAGKAPFAGATDSRPEKRSQLPVSER